MSVSKQIPYLKNGHQDLFKRNEFVKKPSNCDCVHIKEYIVQNTLDSYEIIHGLLVARMTEQCRVVKAKECFCKDEGCEMRLVRVHACLYCAYFGCFENKHIHNHADKYEHFLAMDVDFGFVYCFICKDYKYNSDFERVATSQLEIASRHYKSPEFAEFFHERKISYFKGFRKIPQKVNNVCTPIGVRGILNLGSTCYISAILQALVHAPVISKYYLSDEHQCKYQIEHLPSLKECYQDKENGSLCPATSPFCFSCELGTIVQEFYSGKRGAFIPIRLLTLQFIHMKKELSSYAMNDAHEFFIEFLSLMHHHCEDHDLERTTCCKIGRIFTGIIQNEFQCRDCKSISRIVDHISDICLKLEEDIQDMKINEVQKESLITDTILPCEDSTISTELKNVSLDEKKFPGKGLKNTKGESKPETLFQCLDRNFKSEVLSYSCDNCESKNENNGKLEGKADMLTLLKKLPTILTFHINRLNWKSSPLGGYFREEYNDQLVKFPEIIDMAQYMTSEEKVSSSEASNSEYFLFAAIQFNIGKTKTSPRGHYVSYIRMHRNEWYKCDDENIISVDISDIQNQPMYMLFYHEGCRDSHSINNIDIKR